MVSAVACVSILILFIWDLSFSWWVWLKVYLFCLSFQTTSYWLHWSFVLFLRLYFIYSSSDIYLLVLLTLDCQLCGIKLNKGTMVPASSPWESHPSSPRTAAILFSSFLYVLGTFKAAVHSLDLWAIVCEQESLCVGPLRGHLGLQQPSVSPRQNSCWF